MASTSPYDLYDYPIVDPAAREGHIGNLTPAQQTKLDDLRAALVAEKFDSKRLDTLTLV